MGHSVKDCMSFKGKVQDLINDKSLVFEEDNQNVECGYHTKTMGHVVKECKRFQTKLQKFISTNSKTFKTEGPNMDGLIQKPGKEKRQ